MRRLPRIAMVAVLVLFVLGSQMGTLLAQGNVEGSTYTSPRFDYQLQWSSPWYFVEEGSEGGSDYLVLSDGLSFVQFRFVFSPGVGADEAIGFITEAAKTSESATNVQPLLDAQGVPIAGGDASHAWAGLTSTYIFEDGTEVEVVDYHDVTVLPGGVGLWANGWVPNFFYDESVLLSWQNLISTALIMPETTATQPPTQPTAAPEPTTAPPPVETAVAETPTAVPPATVEGGAGEPAPAFAAGPWRVAARAVDQGEGIGYLGLGVIDGMRWVVVYADVTNWSGADAQLDVAGMTLVTAGGAVAPDQAATQSAATLLGLEPANGTSVQVPAGGSTRLALVYSIPVAEADLILELQGEQLPLADAVGRQLDVTDSSTIAAPAAMTTGTVAMVQYDPAGQLLLRVDTADGMVDVALAGAAIPTGTTCFDQTTTLLTVGELTGQEVWLERDPAVTDADTYYVWYVDDQGNRVMLDQTLVANGRAVEGDLPEAARFGAWIEQTEEIARAEGAGLWTICAGQL